MNRQERFSIFQRAYYLFSQNFHSEHGLETKTDYADTFTIDEIEYNIFTHNNLTL